MDKRDQELLDKQLWSVSSPPQNGPKLRTVKEHPALHYQAISTHCCQFGSKIGSKNLMARPISAATQLQSRQDRQLLGPPALAESNSRSHAHAWRSLRRRNRRSPRYGRVCC